VLHIRKVDAVIYLDNQSSASPKYSQLRSGPLADVFKDIDQPFLRHPVCA
jgi:hypothetical protein